MSRYADDALLALRGAHPLRIKRLTFCPHSSAIRTVGPPASLPASSPTNNKDAWLKAGGDAVHCETKSLVPSVVYLRGLPASSAKELFKDAKKKSVSIVLL